MKKKEYIQPKFTVVKVDLKPLMDASTPGYTIGESFSEEESVGSRRGNNFWDDEDDYDEEY